MSTLVVETPAMDQMSEATDDDLIYFIKNILQNRALPINYKSLRDLLKHAPPHVRTYAERKYTDEKFLNFLLANSNLFNVNPDGSVILLGTVEYVFPQSVGLDIVDSVAAVSDDSYFGDREEYISDSEEEESNPSVCSNQLLLADKMSDFPLNGQDCCKESVIANSSQVGKEGWCDSTSSSDSTQLYLSSETTSNLTTTTESDSQSSFESCDEVHNKHLSSDIISTSSSSSLSYSSCSDN